MTRLLPALADIASRRPRAILALTALLFILAVGVGSPVAGLLDTAGNPFTDPESETEQAREKLEHAAGEKAAVGLLVPVDLGTRIENPAARRRVEAIAATLAAEPAVARTVTAYRPQGSAQVSRDGESTYLAAPHRCADLAGRPSGAPGRARAEGQLAGSTTPARRL